MRKTLLVLTLVTISLILFQTILIINLSLDLSDDLDFRARTVQQGSASLCINYPAELNNTCPEVFNQSTRIENNTVFCEFNATHYSGEDAFARIVDPIPLGIMFNVSENGSVKLWANNSGVGLNTLLIEVIDNSSCPLPKVYEYDFEVLFINDPPEFIGSLRSYEVREGATVLGAFFLSREFTDPDDPILNYTVFGNNNFNVRINSDSSVDIISPLGNCDDEEHIFFRATDPPGLYDDSNMVTLTPICDPPDETPAPSGGGAPPCVTEWQCNSWSACLTNGTQYRDCFDINACDPDNYRRRFWQECEYIPPVEEEEEEVEEEEIQIETPTPPVLQIEEDGLFTTVIITVLVISMVAIVYYGFRKEIRILYARLLWYLMRHQQKQLLLSSEDKEKLLDSINKQADKLAVKDDVVDSFDKDFKQLLSIQKDYYVHSLNLKDKFNVIEFKKNVEKIVLVDSLKKAFKLGFAKYYFLNNKQFYLSKAYVFSYVQELRQLVLNTSSSSRKDMNFKVSELPIKGSGINKIYASIHNAYLALQFREVESAKGYYLACIEFYEDLTDDQKSKVRGEISRLYEYLTYVITWWLKK